MHFVCFSMAFVAHFLMFFFINFCFLFVFVGVFLLLIYIAIIIPKKNVELRLSVFLKSVCHDEVTKPIEWGNKFYSSIQKRKQTNHNQRLQTFHRNLLFVFIGSHLCLLFMIYLIRRLSTFRNVKMQNDHVVRIECSSYLR